MKTKILPHQINYHNVNVHQKKAYANFKDINELKTFIHECEGFEINKPSIKSKTNFAKSYGVGISIYNRAIEESAKLISDFELVYKYKLEAERGLKWEKIE